MRLSVAIPTVHDFDYVRPCLRAILNSFMNLSEMERREVDIFVSINGNKTWTFQAINMLPDGHWVRFNQLSHNIGEAPNVAEIIQNAKGQFIWTVGDDDIIKPFAVGVILGFVKQATGKHFTLNCKTFDFMHMTGLTDTVLYAPLWRKNLETFYASTPTNLYLAVTLLNLTEVEVSMIDYDPCLHRGKDNPRWFHPEKLTLALDLVPKKYRREVARSILPLVLYMLKKQKLSFSERIRETLSISLRYPIRENLRQWRHHAANILRHA